MGGTKIFSIILHRCHLICSFVLLQLDCLRLLAVSGIPKILQILRVFYNFHFSPLFQFCQSLPNSHRTIFPCLCKNTIAIYYVVNFFDAANIGGVATSAFVACDFPLFLCKENEIFYYAWNLCYFLNGIFFCFTD